MDDPEQDPLPPRQDLDLVCVPLPQDLLHDPQVPQELQDAESESESASEAESESESDSSSESCRKRKRIIQKYVDRKHHEVSVFTSDNFFIRINESGKWILLNIQTQFFLILYIFLAIPKTNIRGRRFLVLWIISSRIFKQECGERNLKEKQVNKQTKTTKTKQNKTKEKNIWSLFFFLFSFSFFFFFFFFWLS